MKRRYSYWIIGLSCGIALFLIATIYKNRVKPFCSNGEIIYTVNNKHYKLSLGMRINANDFNLIRSNRQWDTNYITYNTDKIYILLKDNVIVGIFSSTNNIKIDDISLNKKLLDSHYIYNSNANIIYIYKNDYRSIVGNLHILYVYNDRIILVSNNDEYKNQIKAIGIFNPNIIDKVPLINEIRLAKPYKIIQSK